jgi:glutamate synthase domain-containing protein 3/thioredoxin reductase/Pyruvate/2-oxoacid:ferredoxin oxidoreductase delta subunit
MHAGEAKTAGTGTEEVVRIDVGTMHFRALNQLISQHAAGGRRRIVLENVIGQRYIGAGLGPGVEIEIHGIPGQDLGVFNGGARITVLGNAQDGVGNTMNEGTVVVHGSVGDIPGHMARSGRIYVRGSAGFRAGIMMKEYGDTRPVMIVGESIGDYAGEYMAGGVIVVLGYSLGPARSPVSRHVASGMFGGEIFLRGAVDRGQVGSGAAVEQAGPGDVERILPCLEEFAKLFSLDPARILDAPFTLVRRVGGRPYGNLYVPAGTIARHYRPVHRNMVPPCSHACPVGIPNPVIIRLLREQKIGQAFDLIDEYTPFRYSCCGMVCPGLCCSACTRNGVDRPVPIDRISRVHHPGGPVRVLEPGKTQPVAVIGAGPAGLSAAWHLARRGYPVAVYERERDIGGKLTHNIPEQRLPRAEVERDLRRIRVLDIRFHTGTAVDAPLFARLRKSHRAMVIAVGATRPRRLQFPGEERAVTSFAFLRALKTGDPPRELEGKQVVIIGAGNVAMDAACACYRLGASSVTALDVQRPAASGPELERAMGLGARVLFPRFVQCYRENQVFLMNGERLQADLLIESVGEMPELEFAGESVIVRSGSPRTTLPGVFVAGDASAPGLLTHSIAAGRKAALAIHRQLQGLPPEPERAAVVDRRRVNQVYFQQRDPFFNDLDACMSCGTCIQCDLCVEACPRDALKRVGDSFTVDEGLCTGCGTCASVCPRGAVLMEETAGPGAGAD